LGTVVEVVDDLIMMWHPGNGSPDAIHNWRSDKIAARKAVERRLQPLAGAPRIGPPSDKWKDIDKVKRPRR